MEAGAVVAERFEVERRIARGGMGVVYRATDRQSGGRVALKVADERNAGRAARLLCEAEILERLGEPGIVRHVDHGEHEGRAYLAMEWIEGTSLGALLEEGPLGVVGSAAVCAGVASALAAAHARGIVHRDVAPSNVLVQGDAAAPRALLIDFGLAIDVAAGSTDGERSGVAGTPGFIAPEQVRAGAAVDGKADVFALGCVLFRCVTARSPYDSSDARAAMIRAVVEDAPRIWSIDESLPAELDMLVARMLARSPVDRPDAAFVAAALAELRGATSSAGRATSALSPRERAPVSVVLARAPRDTSARELRAALETAGPLSDVRVEMLGDGTLVLIVADRGVATERAVRAARWALALARVLPGAPISVSSVTTCVSADSPLGEVVERGARALGEADRAAIRIDDATAGLLDDAFEVGGDQVGPVLVTERPGGRGVRTVLGRATPFVGRTSELAALQGLFAEARSSGRARLAMVSGDPGIGKSRLRHEWLRHLAQLERPPRVWIGGTDPNAVGAPFALLGAALRDAAGLVAALDPTALLGKLTELAVACMPAADAERTAVFLAEALGISVSDETRLELRAARADRALMGQQIRRAWRDLLDGTTRDEPLVLVLEDVHWADRPSVEVVDAALAELCDRPLVVLALMRPEAVTRFPDLWAQRGPSAISLAALDGTSCAELAREIVGCGMDEALAADLARRSSGNPFHLEEIARAVALGRGEGLPETVLAVTHDRLSRLDGEARRVLRASSILGGSVSPADVRALVGDDAGADTLTSQLELLVQDDLLERDRSAPASSPLFVFRHEIVREAAYATLTLQDRALGHRLAAELLERKKHGDALIVAEHFASSDRAGEAARWYGRAAAQALRANDYASAIASAERSAACGAAGAVLGEARFAEAEAAWFSRDWRRAFHASMEAVELLRPGGASWHAALGLLGLCAGFLQDVARVVEAGHRLLSADVASDAWAPRFVAGCRIGGQLHILGRYDLRSAVFVGLERDAAHVQDDLVGRAALHRAQALAGLYAGDVGRYVEGMRARVGALEALGDDRGLCIALTQLGNAYTTVGEADLAVDAQRRALCRAERVGSEVVAEAKQGLCWALAHAGAPSEAIDVATSAIEAYGSVRTGHVTRVTFSITLTMNGQAEAAEREAEIAAAGLEDSPPVRAIALGALAEARLARDDARGALDAARAAKAILDRLGRISQEEGRVRLAYARALRACGEIEASRRAIGEARAALLAHAAKIAHAKWRTGFLERVPTHATTLQLAREWLDEPA